jgi:hypothetical protein
MSTKRKPIPLTKGEDDLFRKLVIQWRIPRGQFKKHPEYLDAFTQLFNDMSGNNYTSVEIYHYMELQQKITGRLEVPWPTFGGAHKRLPSVANNLTTAHMQVLRSLWRKFIMPLGLGTDAFAYRDDLVQLLTREFEKATKLKVPGMMLASIIETERKRGNWLCLKDQGVGFDDLDLIG